MHIYSRMIPGVSSALARNRKASLIIVLCVLIIGVVLGRLLWPAIAAGIEQAKYAQIGGGIPEYTPDPRQTDEFNQFEIWLFNDVAKRKAPWDVETASRLMAILDARYTEEQVENVAKRPGATMRDQEPILYYMDTKSVVAERLRRNEPIEPEARRMLVLALTDALEDPYYRIRIGAASAICDSRLVKDPAIREMVEAMFNDPDEGVAMNARRQLAHFDKIERLRAEGKWNEPWIKD